MSNVKTYQVWTWDYGMGRYVKEYKTDFGDHISPKEAREHVLTDDRMLPDGKTQFDTFETVLTLVREG